MRVIKKFAAISVAVVCFGLPCSRALGEEKLMLEWNALTNPVYAREGWSVKDACMVYDKGAFYLFFSAFYLDRGRERSHVVGVKTSDFQYFSDPLFIWDGREDGWTGMCSPNISVHDGNYILTYNSWGDIHPNGKKNQLFHAVSQDLETWDKHKPLAANLTVGKRAIDAAIAHSGEKYYLIWKEAQTPWMAYGDSLDGDWERLGKPTGGWFENAQFLKIDGNWALLVTGAGHLPYIMRMKESGQEPEHWLEWSQPDALPIAMETFNTDNKANAAFLADWREHDGYFYLLYAGRTEGTTHAGRGNNKLGLSRSKDLSTWSVPGSSVK